MVILKLQKKQKKLTEGFISVDAIHSPVRRVNYTVNNASIGQRTDYDSLVLEVWTDGSLKPDEAVPLGYKILKEQLQVFMNFDENIEPKETVAEESSSKLSDYLFRPAEDLELSVRSANCLKNARIRYIGDLVTKSEQEMLRTKNFGRKSLNEIKEILKPMGLGLGMEIEGWPPSNLYRKDYQSTEQTETKEEVLTHSHETSNQNYDAKDSEGEDAADGSLDTTGDGSVGAGDSLDATDNDSADSEDTSGDVVSDSKDSNDGNDGNDDSNSGSGGHHLF